MITLIPDKVGFSPIRWFIIGIFLCVIVASGLWKSAFVLEFAPIITILTIFSAVWLHGIERYGIKHMIIFFMMTWLISNFFEAMSIRTGFPFGHYYYDKLIGPRLFDVPLIITFAYFGTGYISWTLANVLLQQTATRLIGKQRMLIPLVASCIMVMWDLCIDPLCSTIAHLWVWKEGGAYFGVPLQNYFGWFFVVYIIYQSFALYISKFDTINPEKMRIFSSKIFWLEPVALYGIIGLSQIVEFIGATDHRDIYGPMAIISLFTMLFVTLISYINVNRP